jgi:hypothetical protein
LEHDPQQASPVALLENIRSFRSFNRGILFGSSSRSVKPLCP